MDDHEASDNSTGIAELHGALVDRLVADGVVRSPGVEKAFRAVPRHLFLPGVPLDDVYADMAIPTRRTDRLLLSSSSQPSMMAIMLEQLDPRPGDRVLEIGTATGYNAAILAHIVGEDGDVVTVEIDPELAASAHDHLDDAGYGRVRTVAGDGAFGVPDAAPYDKILLTVAAGEIAPAWIEQLKPDGVLVLPLTLVGGYQWSIAFERTSDGLTSRSVCPCSFVRLQGALAVPESRTTEIGPFPGLLLVSDEDEEDPADLDALYRTLSGPYHDEPTGVAADGQTVLRRLGRWLSFFYPTLRTVAAQGEWLGRPFVPSLLGRKGAAEFSFGVVEEDRAAMLVRSPDRPLPADSSPDSEPFEVVVRSYGAGEPDAEGLRSAIMEWDRLGRPSAPDGLHVRVLPLGDGAADGRKYGGRIVVDRGLHRFLVEWE